MERSMRTSTLLQAGASKRHTMSAYWHRRLPGWLVEILLRGQALLLYIFLYAPIVVVVIYSFNNSRRVTIWGGFTLKWYYSAWSSPDITSSLQISLTAALINAVLAVSLGTLAALGMRSAPRWLRLGFEALVYMTIITPEIVIAIASLLYFVNLSIDLGVQTIIVTHAVHNTSIVALVFAARLPGF